MVDRQTPLSINVPIANKDGTPTFEFMRKWQAQLSLNSGIADLSTQAAVSGVLDVIDAAQGTLLLRGATLWAGLASPADATKFLNGATTPAYAKVKDSDLALSDVVTGNVSITAHGFAPKASGAVTDFLNGLGAYSVPPSTGDMLKSVYDTDNNGVVDAAATAGTAAALTGTQASAIAANSLKVSDINHVSVLLPNVNNTSDAAKPVSTAQQAALDAKEPALGNPATDGDMVVSTVAGVRSWATPGSGGTTTFIGLTDTPGALGSAGQVPSVNAGATALEFTTPTSGGATTFPGLTDTPASLGGAGQVVSVNAGATALEFTTPASGGATTFPGLTDTPASLGTAGQVVSVNAGATALEFTTPATGGGSTSIVAKTADYTITNTELAGLVGITMSAAADILLTVPTGLTGTEPLVVFSLGVGQTTVVAGTGVTINAADGFLGLRAQYSSAILTPNGSNNYLLSGDLIQGYVAVPSATTFNTISSNLTPTSGWGVLKRNSAYTGFALRVADAAAPSSTTDISFNSNGRVTAALPYGTNTRVVILYDQWGSDDQTAATTDGISIALHGTSSTWHLRFSGVGYLKTSSTAGTATWAIADPLWALGFTRTSDNASLMAVWGVASNSNYMEVGLWLDLHELSYRINGSNHYEFAGTNWTTNASVVQNVLSRVIGDDTQGTGQSYGYFDGTMAIQGAYTNPIVYGDTAAPLGIGGAILGGVSNQDFTELHLFTKVAAANAADIAAIDTALAESDV